MILACFITILSIFHRISRHSLARQMATTNQGVCVLDLAVNLRPALAAFHDLELLPSTYRIDVEAPEVHSIIRVIVDRRHGVYSIQVDCLRAHRRALLLSAIPGRPQAGLLLPCLCPRPTRALLAGHLMLDDALDCGGIMDSISIYVLDAGAAGRPLLFVIDSSFSWKHLPRDCF
jgi:hypothetical protein